MSRALLIVDVQLDFLPGGPLGVTDGHKIIPDIVRIVEEGDYKVIVASRDWHPKNHVSFEGRGGQWPVHCLQDTTGAAIDWDILNLDPIIVTKGADLDRDAYSAFEGTTIVDSEVMTGSGEEVTVPQAAALGSVLDVQYGITQVDVVGLATDYCVKATAISGVEKGFDTRVILECTRPVDVVTGMIAVGEMAQAGVRFE